MNSPIKTGKRIAHLCAAIVLSWSAVGAVQAATTHHRLTWDSDPSSNAVIGFSPDGSSVSPYVRYGYSTNESQWLTQNVTATYTFDGSLTSHFARLTNLQANSAVYFRVCDQDGCGQRFWFRTAPTDNSPFVAVAGGDTRTGWDTRRAGNRLIAKIRPLFITHGGDFTDDNNTSQMAEYLKDWQLTFSDDNIDGYNYKRIYPFIPTHGNHEDDDYSTLCRVFGVDYNQDGQCNPSDTYGAFNVSPLLRIYTLNSQFQNSGWASYASAMNNWLGSDLSSNGGSAVWRIAQYHKPMYPHYSGKRDNPTLHTWWANDFYTYAMNLVVESDTHIAKVTKALFPSGSSFAETTAGGTVYVGEGSWGAPARSANDGKSWTQDLASIQQFKVLTVSGDKIDVRTAQFNGSASTLTRSMRASDSTRLPTGINWWSVSGIGENMVLTQGNARRSIISNADSGSDSNTIEVAVARSSDDAEERVSDGDMYLSSSDLEMVYDSFVDGDQVIGVRFQNITIPQGATITEAYLEFLVNETNTRSTSLAIRAQNSDDAGTFTNSDYNISSRPTTGASVSWVPAAWNVLGSLIKTPDLSSLVQEVVNRTGWNAGNSMAFIINGSGKRVAESYDGDAAPRLHLKFSEASGGSSSGGSSSGGSSSGGSSSGGTTGGSVAPGIVSPADGASLSSDVQTFTWQGSNVQGWWLYVGTSVGGSDLSSSGYLTGNSYTVNNLPTDGSRVYVRLWSNSNNSWSYQDYSFTAATSSSTAPPPPPPASSNEPAIIAPTPGATLSGSSQIFTLGGSADGFWLYAGSTVGGSDYASSGLTSLSKVALSNLPTDGSTVHVRLWIWNNGQWQNKDYSFTAAR